MLCPKCKNDCDRDEVDVGVGVIYGPYGCYHCGWSEDPYYDSSKGLSQADKDNPGMLHDSLGGAMRRTAVEDRMRHFGIPIDLLDGDVPDDDGRGDYQS